MSRSYRKPYCSVCGCSSRWDKTQAHRGERRVLRKQNRLLTPASWEIPPFQWDATYWNWDAEEWVGLCDTALPHDRLACPHNNTWGWNRDGKQMYYGPPFSGRWSWSPEEAQEYAKKLSRK